MPKLTRVRPLPEVFVELRPSTEGCYVTPRIEGAPDLLTRTFTGAFGSRDEAVSEAARWVLGWLRRLRSGRGPSEAHVSAWP